MKIKSFDNHYLAQFAVPALCELCRPSRFEQFTALSSVYWQQHVRILCKKGLAIGEYL